LLIHLEKVFLALKVFLEFLDLIFVYFCDILLLVLVVVKDLLHDEKPGIQLIALFGCPFQLALQELIFLG
jgi:hypothetical protein